MQQGGEGADVLAMDFDELEAAVLLLDGDGMDGLHQRGLAHAACAPKHGVIGGQATGEAQGVFQQERLLTVHPFQEIERDAGNLVHRGQVCGGGMPDEGLGRFDIGGVRGRRCQTFQRPGNSFDLSEQTGVHAGSFQPAASTLYGPASRTATRARGPTGQVC